MVSTDSVTSNTALDMSPSVKANLTQGGGFQISSFSYVGGFQISSYASTGRACLSDSRNK